MNLLCLHLKRIPQVIGRIPSTGHWTPFSDDRFLLSERVIHSRVQLLLNTRLELIYLSSALFLQQFLNVGRNRDFRQHTHFQANATPPSRSLGSHLSNVRQVPEVLRVAAPVGCESDLHGPRSCCFTFGSTRACTNKEEV